MLTAAEIYRC